MLHENINQQKSKDKCYDQLDHCHDKKTDNCIPFIEDCHTHWEKCSDGCHCECACQNP